MHVDRSDAAASTTPVWLSSYKAPLGSFYKAALNKLGVLLNKSAMFSQAFTEIRVF